MLQKHSTSGAITDVAGCLVLCRGLKLNVALVLYEKNMCIPGNLL